MYGSEHGSERRDSGRPAGTGALRRAARLFATFAVAAALAGCVPFQLKAILDGPKGVALSLNPSAIIVPATRTVFFSANGGVPPYVYSLVSGGGTLDPVTGVYTAPVSVGSAVVRVTDATGKSAQATITIQVYAGALAVSPGAVSLQLGSNVTFTPIGGTPPYTFAIQTAGSGTPTVNASTGYYVAGGTPGTDVVRVTDAAAATVTASVSVTVLTSNVDYTVPSTNLPGAGTISSAIPGGYSFTLRNSGSAPGTQTVSWQVFLSSNTLIDGGDIMVASGTISPSLAAGASVPVNIVAGAFPAVPPGAWYLIAQVSAADDTTPANNDSGAVSITLSPLNINYTPAGPSSSVGTTAGAAMSGTLSITNIGSAGDTAGGEWAVYASVDTALDASDYLLARGTFPGLAGSGASTGPMPFSGYWPSTPNTWHLIAQVSAPNDIVPGDDITAGATIVVTGPPPANVDYVVVSVNNTGGATAGDPLTGSFTARNTLADPGAQPVFWTAYLSSDTTLQIGTDPVIDSGSFTQLAGGATTVPAITFAGTWPSGPATWYLIVAVSSFDDITPGNNVTVSAAVTTTLPNVNYTTQSVQSTAGTTAGSPLAGSFVIKNVGTHGGGQFVPWAVYLSPDAALDVGSDMLLATGSLASPGLAAGVPSGAIPFSGTWPAAATVKTWYLIAAVGAGDDVNGTDNSSASAVVTVNPPNIDYTIPAVPGVTSTGGTTGGGPITGSFTLKNNGTADGTVSVSWTAYASSNATLDVTDQVVDTGTTPQLTAGSSTPITFGGTWPAGTATWYLIVKVSASDDVNNANDTLASSAVAVTGAAPVYSITAVPVPTGSTTGQAVNGTITIQNTALTSGVAAVNWQVYASLGDAVYNAGDTLLASGSIVGGLGAGASSSPAWAGTWPATAGTYYIVVRASAADAPTVPDAASASIIVSNPPSPDYTVSFDPNIPWSGLTGTAMSTTGTCQITIQNLTVNPGHANVTWYVYLSLDKVLDGGDMLVQSGSISALAGSGSQVITFGGNWPAVNTYYLIATVYASDDANHADDTVPATHVSAVGNFRYVEGAENNSGTPSPNFSTTGASMVANQTLVIEGTMDAYIGVNAQRDTYKFATTATTNFAIRALWATGHDDVDLDFWDTTLTKYSSAGAGIDSEPGGNPWDFILGWPAGTYYISALAYLEANTSGDAGQKYVITVAVLP